MTLFNIHTHSIKKKFVLITLKLNIKLLSSI